MARNKTVADNDFLAQVSSRVKGVSEDLKTEKKPPVKEKAAEKPKAAPQKKQPAKKTEKPKAEEKAVPEEPVVEQAEENAPAKKETKSSGNPLFTDLAAKLKKEKKENVVRSFYMPVELVEKIDQTAEEYGVSSSKLTVEVLNRVFMGE